MSSTKMKSKNHTARLSDNGRDTILCNWPDIVTVSLMEEWISRDDTDSRLKMTDFIYHRLHHRYLRPLENLGCEFKSGFLTMAACCLLIETLYSFYMGKEQTDEAGRTVFVSFFKAEEDFRDFANPSVMFYKNIRCGILHQAQTQGGYRIVRDDSPILDVENRSINANKFMEAIKRSLNRYKSRLIDPKVDPKLWNHARKKLAHICKVCKWE